MLGTTVEYINKLVNNNYTRNESSKITSRISARTTAKYKIFFYKLK
jgi:hypothetical protein